MKLDAKPTSRPWTVKRKREVCPADNDMFTCAYASGATQDEAEANAALIVHSHKAKVERLEAALKAMRKEAVTIGDAIWAQEVSSAGILHDSEREESASAALARLRDLIRTALVESPETKENS